MPQQVPQGLDPTAFLLTKAIKQTETSGSPDAYSMPGKSGEYGAYQYTPDTWAVESQKYLGQSVPLNQATEAQQNQVAYSAIADQLKQGKTQSQIASWWNSGNYDPNAVGTGTNKYGVKYDVPGYVNKVKSNYQQIQQQFPSTESGPDQAQASTGTSNAASKVPDYAGAIGNFLFPVAGDIGAIAQGKPTGKTGLQIAGDAAMSALPFIPGLGEVGEGIKGAEAAGEGLNAARDTGLLGKLAGSTVARNAAVGYGAGVASNLQQGQGLGQSFAPNLNTIGGTVLGGAGGLAGKALGGILDSASGIPKNRVPLLANLSEPKLYDEYAQVGANRAADERAPSLLQNGIQHAQTAVKQVQQNLADAGAKVGALKQTEGVKPLTSVDPVLKKFAQDVESKFGKTISIDNSGKVYVENAPGRVKDTLSPSDTTRLKTALKQIINLRKGGTVRKASDVIDNLDSLVDYSKKDLLGNSNDPLEGFLKSTRHNLNDVVGKSSPALAEAKSRASDLFDTIKTIKSGGGSDFQRAGLLLRRALSPDQGDVSQNIFNIIKKETGIDLQEHAGLIKHFTDVMGDKSEKSALQNLLEESAIKGGTTIPDLLLKGGKNALNATFANPVKEGRRIVQGKPGILQSVLRNNPLPIPKKYGKSLTGGLITKGLLKLGNTTSPYVGK